MSLDKAKLDSLKDKVSVKDTLNEKVELDKAIDEALEDVKVEKKLKAKNKKK